MAIRLHTGKCHYCLTAAKECVRGSASMGAEDIHALICEACVRRIHAQLDLEPMSEHTARADNARKARMEKREAA